MSVNRTMTMKNIIFDLGNVLLTFKPKEFLLGIMEDEKKVNSFTSKAIMTETWLKLDRGTISVDNAIKKLKVDFPEEMDMIDLFFTHWMDMFKPIKKNVKIAERLKQEGYNLYILSNFILEPCEEVNRRLEFFKLFDGAVYSYQMHHLKPENEMYAHLTEMYGLNPEESVFLDDHQECLIPAEEMGMKVIWVQEDTDIQEELLKLGIAV